MSTLFRAFFAFLSLFIMGATVTAADAVNLPDGLYARFDTTKGVIVCRLFYDQTPMTVANFVGLAEGTLDTRVKRGQPFYDGIVFHRVIANFMIQGGCPRGDGTGSPGYRFPDEFVPSLKHDSAGILSMANSGPDSNGSQFFITHVPTPHLDGKHTVFGKVVEGQDVVNAIRQGDVINHVTILRVGEKASALQVDQKLFDAMVASASGKTGAAGGAAAGGDGGSDYAKTIREYGKQAKTSMSGLKYVILKEGSGDRPRPGQRIVANYTGRFMDGRVFDSSEGREPIDFRAGKGEVIEGWDEALLDMTVGEKRALIIPPNLAYGRNGSPPVIPGDATLFFEVERVK